jgi:hypothetical protein
MFRHTPTVTQFSAKLSNGCSETQIVLLYRPRSLYRLGLIGHCGRFQMRAGLGLVASHGCVVACSLWPDSLSLRSCCISW